MVRNHPYEQLLTFNKRLYSGKNKRHYILQYSAKFLSEHNKIDDIHLSTKYYNTNNRFI